MSNQDITTIADTQALEIRVLTQWPAYGVSINGDVWSRYRRVYGTSGLKGGSRCVIGDKWKKLILATNNCGYLQARLSVNGVYKLISVHRLVAGAFLGDCPTGHQVNHKNGNKTDNSASNLEYVTASENIRHAFATGLNRAGRGERHGTKSFPERYRGERCSTSVLTEERVLEIRKQHQLKCDGFPHKTKKQLALEYGISVSNIHSVVVRKIWRHI